MALYTFKNDCVISHQETVATFKKGMEIHLSTDTVEIFRGKGADLQLLVPDPVAPEAVADAPVEVPVEEPK